MSDDLVTVCIECDEKVVAINGPAMKILCGNCGHHLYNPLETDLPKRAKNDTSDP